MTPDLFDIPTCREPASVEQERNSLLRKLEKSIGQAEVRKLREFVLDLLHAGPLSGEQLTDRATTANLLHGNPKRMGAVLAGLSRQRMIEKVGSCPRSKGHLTAGGILWSLSNPETTN